MGSTVVDVELLTELWTPDGKMTGFGYDPGAAQALGRMDRPGGLAAVEYDWGCIPYRAARDLSCPPRENCWELREVQAVTQKRVFGGGPGCNGDGIDRWTYDRPMGECLTGELARFNGCGCPCGATCDPGQSPQTNPSRVKVTLPCTRTWNGGWARNVDEYYFHSGCRRGEVNQPPNGTLGRVDSYAGGVLRLSREMDHEWDAAVGSAPGEPDEGTEYHPNPRAWREMTTYEDDDERRTWLVRCGAKAVAAGEPGCGTASSWDGRGHYQVTLESTTEGGAAERRTETPYATGAAALQEWFLGNLTRKTVYPRRKPPTPTDPVDFDFEQLYTRDAYGRLWHEERHGARHYLPVQVFHGWVGQQERCELWCGGDFSAASPCPSFSDRRLTNCQSALRNAGCAGAGTEPYGDFQDYANGAVAGRWPAGLGWATFHVERYLSGAIEKEFDPMERYYRQRRLDGLGRVWRLEHRDGSGTDEAALDLDWQSRTHLKWTRNQAEGEPLYDGYGRLAREWRQAPEGQAESGFHRYRERDGLGNLLDESDWCAAGTTCSGRRYYGYDPLGRPAFIKWNQGGADVETLAQLDHSGLTTTETYWVRTGSVNEEFTRNRVRDGFGRLVRVGEPAPGGGRRETHHAYDSVDRLVWVGVCQDGDGNGDCDGPGFTQERFFEFDAFGNLRKATEPESGTTEHYLFDARGHVRATTDASSVTVKREYDCAERPTRVDRDRMGQSYPLVERSYDGSYPGRLVGRSTPTRAAPRSRTRTSTTGARAGCRSRRRPCWGTGSATSTATTSTGRSSSSSTRWRSRPRSTSTSRRACGAASSCGSATTGASSGSWATAGPGRPSAASTRALATIRRAGCENGTCR
jgi:hypothetical protein